MWLYVVERRLPNAIMADLVMVHEAIVFACERLTLRGEPVRCLGSAYLPGPGRLLSLFEAETGEAVRTVNQNVHTPFDSLEAAIKIDSAEGLTAMTIDEIVSHALGEKRPTSRPHVATGDSAASLTRRELEIAHLIAEGLTSQQIAAKLFISERTVTTHVTNMLNKLGLGSRIQLARRVTASQSPSTRNT